jgi:hypothetical protein
MLLVIWISPTLNNDSVVTPDDRSVTQKNSVTSVSSVRALLPVLAHQPHYTLNPDNRCPGGQVS